jgi:hypothetical protein
VVVKHGDPLDGRDEVGTAILTLRPTNSTIALRVGVSFQDGRVSPITRSYWCLSSVSASRSRST